MWIAIYPLRLVSARLELIISEEIGVNTTVKTWVNGFTDAFRSAMSYADCNDVSDFGPAKVNFVKISNRSFAFYQKKF